ncbi:MAG: hypothetical protein QXI75_01725 [Candidatus Anstonellales archaeon]
MKIAYQEVYYYLEGLESRIGEYQKKIAKKYIETSYDPKIHYLFAKGDFNLEIPGQELLKIRKDLSNILLKLTGGDYNSKIESHNDISVKLSDVQKILKLVHEAKINAKNIIDTTDQNYIHKYTIYVKSNIYKIIDEIDFVIKRNTLNS